MKKWILHILQKNTKNRGKNRCVLPHAVCKQVYKFMSFKKTVCHSSLHTAHTAVIENFQSSILTVPDARPKCQSTLEKFQRKKIKET